MKKLMVAAVTLSLLTGGVAFAGKKAMKKEKPKTVECQVGDKKMMTASNLECTNMGGLVVNFPAPPKEMPKAKKAKKKM